MDRSLSPDRRADLVIEQMTLDEKIGLVHGSGITGTVMPPRDLVTARSNGGAGFVPGIPRLGIPDLNMADSAVGVTRNDERSRYSTPLPSTLMEAASWDPQLAYEYGALIGRELRDQGYNMSLAGGVNLTREPRNGRNFEYQGEDPILAGTMAGHYMKGLEDQHVIGDVKHYALNDQETGRNIGSANLEHRAMRESDLLAFEIALRQSGAGAVMCAYNRINSDYACENDYTLNQVLKKDWGFKGWVLSDWGGTHSAAKAANAGLDQEMPGSRFFGDALRKAVDNGEVSETRLNDMVHRILRTEFAAGIIDDPPKQKVVDVFGGLEYAQRFAEQGIVLLKNANGQLPLNAGTVRSIALIGSHADVAVLSGGGSAQVYPPGGSPVTAARSPEINFGRGVVWYPSSPLRAIAARAPHAKVTFHDGADPTAAAAFARSSEIAVVFVNQPSSEAFDQPSLTLPGDQDRLVAAVAAANPHTIVVIESGGPVAMPWVDGVSSVLECWYPGIRGAEALTRILFGDVNPSAKLPVTFAKNDADLPHPQIAGLTARAPAGLSGGARPNQAPFDINYTEGLKVGYKWYDAEDKQPLFEFGHGLSYTTFAYSGLKADAKQVVFTVRNTGRRAGAEIAQVYASLPANTGEPPRRLVAWQKVELAAGQSKTVTVALEQQYLSVFNDGKDAWELAPGEYQIFAGGSSRDIPLKAAFSVR